MDNYINNTQGSHVYLFTLSKLLLSKIKKGNCLSLGLGAGHSEIKLLKKMESYMY